MNRAYREREQDILDQRWFGQITNEQCQKLLADLYGDWYEAQATLRQALEADTKRS